MATDLTPKRPDVSITFKLSAVAHDGLMAEISLCGCNTSSFIRSALMSEILDRKQRRKANERAIQLRGQMDIEGRVNA